MAGDAWGRSGVVAGSRADDDDDDGDVVLHPAGPTRRPWYFATLTDDDDDDAIEGAVSSAVSAEDRVLALFEALARGDADTVARLAPACLAMPWQAHLVPVFEAHGFNVRTGRFENVPSAQSSSAATTQGAGSGSGASSCSVATLYQAARHAGAGANRMPFPRPRIEPCALHKAARVDSSGKSHAFDVVKGRARSYALVSLLRGCNYGAVCYGVRVEEVTKNTWGGSASFRDDASRYVATSEEVAVKKIERTTYLRHVRRRGGALNEDPIKEIAAMQAMMATQMATQQNNNNHQNHHHVLPLLDCFADDERLYVVVPFCGKGDLFSLVERHGKLPDRLARLYFSQICRGVASLHAAGIAHHDLSLENVLRATDTDCVVIDFGMAVKVSGPTRTKFIPVRRRQSRGDRQTTGISTSGSSSSSSSRRRGGPHHTSSSPHVVDGASSSDESRLFEQPAYHAVPTRPSVGWPCKCGKRDYMAPELLNPSKAFDLFAADVWALGVILYILLVGFPPWDSKTDNPDHLALERDDCYAYIRAGRLDDLLAGWNIRLKPSAVDLLSRLLDYEPTTRITLPQVMRHPWVFQDHGR